MSGQINCGLGYELMIWYPSVLAAQEGTHRGIVQ